MCGKVLPGVHILIIGEADIECLLERQVDGDERRFGNEARLPLDKIGQQSVLSGHGVDFSRECLEFEKDVDAPIIGRIVVTCCHVG